MKPSTEYIIVAIAAFLSAVSFIQLESAAADKNKKLKAFWWIAGFAFAAAFVYLLIQVINGAGSYTNGAD